MFEGSTRRFSLQCRVRSHDPPYIIASTVHPRACSLGGDPTYAPKHPFGEHDTCFMPGPTRRSTPTDHESAAEREPPARAATDGRSAHAAPRRGNALAIEEFQATPTVVAGVPKRPEELKRRGGTRADKFYVDGPMPHGRAPGAACRWRCRGRHRTPFANRRRADCRQGDACSSVRAAVHIECVDKLARAARRERRGLTRGRSAGRP